MPYLVHDAVEQYGSSYTDTYLLRGTGGVHSAGRIIRQNRNINGDASREQRTSAAPDCKPPRRANERRARASNNLCRSSSD